MKFKVDENLPVDAADLLINAGHDAATVFEEHLAGKPDADIIAVCTTEERILITLDTDFSNILTYPPEHHSGIIVIRTDDQSKPAVLKLLRRITLALQNIPVSQRLWIVEENRIRIREAGKG